jgi:hypothetical protein
MKWKTSLLGLFLVLSLVWVSPFCFSVDEISGLTPEVTLLLNEVDKVLILLDKKFEMQEIRFQRLETLSKQQSEQLVKSDKNLGMAQMKLVAAEKSLQDSETAFVKHLENDKAREFLRKAHLFVAIVGTVGAVSGYVISNMPITIGGLAITLIVCTSGLLLEPP